MCVCVCVCVSVCVCVCVTYRPSHRSQCICALSIPATNRPTIIHALSMHRQQQHPISTHIVTVSHSKDTAPVSMVLRPPPMGGNGAHTATYTNPDMCVCHSTTTIPMANNTTPRTPQTRMGHGENATPRQGDVQCSGCIGSFTPSCNPRDTCDAHGNCGNDS